ncbi:hypothetical protein MKX01_004224 [Papaver californicum]|nr:hypothetical protein MKX01_004224 [Papaver californicum]
MERDNKGIVCVTGVAGYFATWLIKSLLEYGYTVRTTVRSNSKASGNKLQVFTADLERPESFDNVIDGLDALVKTEELQDKMINASVEGSIGVLKACLKSKTVKKVIFTSSAAAVLFISNKKDVEEIKENRWSAVDTSKKSGKFQFAQQHGLDLVSVLPPMIVGRFLTSSLRFSLKISQALVLDAKGRNICFSAVITIHDIAKFISTKYPELQLPTEKVCTEVQILKKKSGFNCRQKSCAFCFKYNFEDMYTDAIQCYKDKKTSRRHKQAHLILLEFSFITCYHQLYLREQNFLFSISLDF